MSLILDALRKLEREKDAREPGVLVVGSVPWGERSRAGRVRLAAGAAAVLALAAFVGWLLRPAARPTAPAAAGESGVTRATPGPPVTAAASTLPPPVAKAVAAAPSTLPPAPPIRLSRPLPLPAAAPRPAPRADPEPASVAPTPEPEAAIPADPSPAGSISVAPAAEPAEVPHDPPADQPAGGPAPEATAPADDLRLNAISRRDGRPVALINDRLVFEGDSFDGVRVLRIGEIEVEVEVNGRRRVLRF